MKKKILFNIIFIIQLIISVFFIVYFCYRLIDVIKFYLEFLNPPEHSTFYVEESYFIQNIFRDSIFIVLCGFILFVSIFMLIYINKKDITVLSASVVDKMKEQRKQKAKEKKQQKIDALEEQLKQLKKDE